MPTPSFSRTLTNSLKERSSQLLQVFFLACIRQFDPICSWLLQFLKSQYLCRCRLARLLQFRRLCLQAQPQHLQWLGAHPHFPQLNPISNLLQVALATTTGSFDGGDQGLLNTHFSSWATQVRTIYSISTGPFLNPRISRSTCLSCTTWLPPPPTPTCLPSRSSAPTWRSSTSLGQRSLGWERGVPLQHFQGLSIGSSGGNSTLLRFKKSRF